MLLFQKKKLTLREIHELYLLLKPCLPEKEENYLVDELIGIVGCVSEEIFLKCIEVMYKKNFQQGSILELLILFTKGITNNNFFEYVKFLKGMNGKV